MLWLIYTDFNRAQHKISDCCSMAPPPEYDKLFKAVLLPWVIGLIRTPMP